MTTHLTRLEPSIPVQICPTQTCVRGVILWIEWLDETFTHAKIEAGSYPAVVAKYVENDETALVAVLGRYQALLVAELLTGARLKQREIDAACEFIVDLVSKNGQRVASAPRGLAGGQGPSRRSSRA